MDPVLTVAFAVGVPAIGAGVVFLLIRHARRADEAWEVAARRLQLTSEPRGVLGERKIGGFVDGVAVVVETVTRRHGQASTTFTCFSAVFPRDLGFPLYVGREDPSAAWAVPPAVQDIRTRDGAFDRACRIQGSDEAAVLRYLTAERRRAIQEFLDEFPTAVVHGGGAFWERAGILRDAGRIVAGVRGLITLAGALAPGAAPVAEEGPAAPEPAPVAAALDPSAFCAELFGPGLASYESSQRFDRSFARRAVRWSGTLRSVAPFTFDATFGRGPATKAVVEIAEGDGRKVVAILHLPADTQEWLRDQLGGPVAFEGTLLKIDAFMRQVWVGAARVVPPRSSDG